jgi:hypothetical protein
VASLSIPATYKTSFSVEPTPSLPAGVFLRFYGSWRLYAIHVGIILHALYKAFTACLPERKDNRPFRLINLMMGVKV